MFVLKPWQRQLKRNFVLMWDFCSAEFVVCLRRTKKEESAASLVHPAGSICSLWHQNRCWSVRHTERRSRAPGASPEGLLTVLGEFIPPQMGQLIETVAPRLISARRLKFAGVRAQRNTSRASCWF